MNLEQFTQHVLTLLQREYPTRGFRSGEELGVITDGVATFGMSNLFAQFQQIQAQQSELDENEFTRAIIEKFGDAMRIVDEAESPIPENWDEAREKLRVQLVNARVAAQGQAITFPFSDDVYSSLVIDCDRGYAYVNQDDLERWGLSAVDAIEIGKKNVVLAQPALPMAVMRGDSPLVSIQTGDGYDAARVLIEPIRARIIAELTGDEDGVVYAAVPNRDFLIAWPTDLDADVHQRLCDTVANDARKRSHPLSERILRLSKQTIEMAF
ncbi:MAG: hypothetical protein AAFV88_01315 [Planctomycetota bacterium]